MGKIIFNNNVSLDGFVAGLNNEVDQLFRWYNSGDTEVPLPGPGLVFKVSRASAELFRRVWPTIGAAVTGRQNFDNAQGWGRPSARRWAAFCRHPSALSGCKVKPPKINCKIDTKAEATA